MKTLRVLVLAGLLLAACAPMSSVRSQSGMDQINNSVVALVSTFDYDFDDPDPRIQSSYDMDPTLDRAGEHPQSPYCAGTFISRSLVLTAAHCVDLDEDDSAVNNRVKAATYSQYLASDGRFDNYNWQYFTVVAFDREKDLALLRVDSPIHVQYTSLRLSSDGLYHGDRVLVSGHPRGLAWSLTDGIVSSPTRNGSTAYDIFNPDGDHNIYVQVSAPVYYGNSGGPLINSNNELVGVVSNGGPWHIAMCVHVRQTKRFLYEYNTAQRTN